MIRGKESTRVITQSLSRPPTFGFPVKSVGSGRSLPTYWNSCSEKHTQSSRTVILLSQSYNGFSRENKGCIRLKDPESVYKVVT